ncbi:DNA polymerase [Parasutterella excrementihominis]
MSLVTIDFETYYSKEFSLSKMTTESYIRDPQFEVIGVSVKIDSGGIRWITENIGEELKALHLEEHQVLCHNTAFDGAILSWIYDIHPKFLFDTLSMARPLTGLTVGGSLRALSKLFGLGEKGTEIYNTLDKRKKDFTRSELDAFGVYCRQDVNLTYHLFKKLLPYTTKGELVIIDMMLRMFTEPKIVLDKPRLEAHLADVRAKKQELLSRIPFTKDQLMSNNLFAEVLKSLGVVPPTKISPTTGKETFAFAKTDDGFKELLEHPNEDVQAVAAARLGTKSTIEETRTENMIGIANRGALPILLNYWGGSTGRASGGDKMNLQNLPRGGEIRKSLIAPPGHMICACDSSNIEGRVNAWFCGQADLVKHFAEGNDVYCELASKIYGRKITKADKKERFVGKTATLGLGYQVGWRKLQSALKNGNVEMSDSECQRVVDIYRSSNYAIKSMWQICSDVLSNMVAGYSGEFGEGVKLKYEPGKIYLPNGMFLLYPELRYCAEANDKEEKGYSYRRKNFRTKIYGGKLCIAKDTPVLTSRGWIPIQDVALTDKVWDGVEWVEHTGVAFNGTKQVIEVFGVSMTKDHRVLTNDGWRTGETAERFDRAEVRLPDSCEVFSYTQKSEHVVFPMRMREGSSERLSRHKETSKEWLPSKLWLQAQRAFFQGFNETRHGGNTNMECLAFNEAEMHRPQCSGMEKLRRTWDQGLRKVAGKVREFLCGYGPYLQGWAYAGPDRCERELRAIELPLDNNAEASEQQTQQCKDWRPDNSGVCQKAWLGSNNSSLQNQERSPIRALSRPAGFESEVFDITNCGPRHRYVVQGSDGKPLIVHNCENIVQALARIVVFDQMGRIAQKLKEKGGNSNGKIRQVVLTVHDEVVVVVPEEEAEETKAMMEEMMRVRPAWAPDLPVDCEGGIGKSYGEAK